MADRYLKTGGSGAGSDWTTAYATVAAVEAADTAGDTIYVSNNHSETGIASAVSIPSAGTLAAPTKMICVDDSATPPTTLAQTAVIGSATTNTISVNGNIYLYGMKFLVGTGATSGALFTAGNVTGSTLVNQTYEKAAFELTNTGTGNVWRVGVSGAANAGIKVQAIDCTWKFYAAAQGIKVENGRLEISGGVIQKDSGLANLTAVFQQSVASKGVLEVNGLDMSALNASVAMFNVPGPAFKGVLKNCRLPDSWTGNLSVTAPSPGCRIEMYNCDSGATNYRMWVQEYTGSIKSETAIVRTGGASDGTTSLSWNMTSSADAEYPQLALSSPEMVIWNDTVDGSTKTLELETLAADSVNLTNSDFWIEVTYLGSSSTPIGSVLSTRKANMLASSTTYSTSSASWSGSGAKQKVSVSFIPLMKGFISVVARLAKPSVTVYVCPKVKVV
jgi:hypothetical protein